MYKAKYIQYILAMQRNKTVKMGSVVWLSPAFDGRYLAEPPAAAHARFDPILPPAHLCLAEVMCWRETVSHMSLLWVIMKTSINPGLVSLFI